MFLKEALHMIFWPELKVVVILEGKNQLYSEGKQVRSASLFTST